MQYFPYGQTEIEYLSKVDSRLGNWISQVGLLRREVILDPFTALLSSVVSQQISRAAAATVWRRLTELVGCVVPSNILSASVVELRACGLSQRKVGYILGVAEAALSGQVVFSQLNSMPEEQIMATLVGLKGVGPWTVEMLCIFSLLRPNILSYSDLGIQRGLQRLHALESVSRQQFEQYQELYSPYGSTASLYLWELAATDNFVPAVEA